MTDQETTRLRDGKNTVYEIVPKKNGGDSLLYTAEKTKSPMWKEWRLIEISAAEIIGTAMLMLFGCMSLVSFGEKVPSMQPGMMFGAVVATIIVIFGHISNAHLNPSVTVAALTLGSINYFTAIVYVISQCVGACIGYGLLKVLTPHEVFCGVNGTCTICTTTPHPSLAVYQVFLAEFLATSFLIYTVCGVWDERNSKNTDAVPIKFALAVAALSIVEGPYTACSMNPARSLAPAIFSGIWTLHWVYWAAPLLAGFLTALTYQSLFQHNRQKVPSHESVFKHSKTANSEGSRGMIKSPEESTINTHREDVSQSYP